MNNWRYPVLSMIFIFIVSAIPGDIVDAAGFGRESYHLNGHFILFFILTICFYKATKDILLSLVYSFLYAVVDELHQHFVPGRAVQMLDILVDMVGSVTAGVILWRFQQHLPVKLKNWLLK